MTKKKEIGRIIKTMRLSRNMTQKELAARLHQSPSSITMYETGRRAPDYETLEALADVFNVPLSTLVDETPDVQAEQSQSPRISLIARGMEDMTEEEQERFIAMAKAAFPALFKK